MFFFQYLQPLDYVIGSMWRWIVILCTFHLPNVALGPMWHFAHVALDIILRTFNLPSVALGPCGVRCIFFFNSTSIAYSWVFEDIILNFLSVGANENLLGYR